RLVFRRPFGQFHPRLARQLLHRFRKTQVLGLHQPAESVAALAAAETFVEPALILDLEAGRFLGMERAATPHHPALADQLDAAAHQRDQIGPPPDLLQQSLAKTHGASLGTKARFCAEKPGARPAAALPPVHEFLYRPRLSFASERAGN